MTNKEFAKQCLEKHKKQWDSLVKWLQSVPEKAIDGITVTQKLHDLYMYFSDDPVESLLNSSFGCTYDRHVSILKRSCKNCLFGDFQAAACMGSLYKEFIDAVDEGAFEEAIELAKDIRDQPLREELQ